MGKRVHCMTTTVMNIRRATWNDVVNRTQVLIDRRTRWGNPFRIGSDGTREEVIEKYRQWLKAQPELLTDIHVLKGKILLCWCKPLPCHGDVLAELAEAIP